MKTIGLIAAMAQESNALLRCLKSRGVAYHRSALPTPGRLPCHSFELSGRACLLVTSGMGVRRASQAAQALVDAGRPDMLISFGIAGAVQEDLQIGDVVALEAACQLEGERPGPLQPLAAWPAAACEAAAQVLAERGARLVPGTAVTTGGSQVSESQLGTMEHPVLEMETAGITRVAAEKGVPLLALRAISDGPRAPIPFDLGEVMDAEANVVVGKMLKALARRPGILLQAGRMMRNSRTAADNAACALVAALSVHSIGLD